jgi:DnaK suppressor protein
MTKGESTMTRQEALLRLQKTLLARREDLNNLLVGELAYLHDFNANDARGDSADLAFEAGSDEMSSRLAELDARELRRVERVLTRLKEGTYGLCEGDSAHCQYKIPLARLNALPYATLCINCERELEKSHFWQAQQFTASWAQVCDFQAPKEDPRMNLSKLETQLSCTRGFDFSSR